MNLTTQELVILLVLIIAIGGVLAFLFKSAIKIVVTGVLICALWVVGFEWLPTKWEQIQKNEITPGELVGEIKNTIVSEYEDSGLENTIDNAIEVGGAWIDENKDSWIDSFHSLIQKLTGTYIEPEETPLNPDNSAEPETDNSTEIANNTIEENSAPN